MNATKRKRPWSGKFNSLAEILTGSGRDIVIGIVMVALFLGGSVFAWNRFSGQFNTGVLLGIDNIQITQQPIWIHSDIKADVIRDSRLGEMRMTDEAMAARIADAFSLHSWVARVDRVRLFPKSVKVELHYRRPVAMVEVNTDGQRGLLPIDTEGFLLPPDDFSPNQARDYLRIFAGDVQPAGPVGTPWGDRRIVDSARIADVWSEKWKQLGLYRIVAAGSRKGLHQTRQNDYELETRGGVRIIWGSPPQQERSGEASAEIKIARLIKHVNQHGPLDSEGGPAEIDVSDIQKISVTPKTASLRKPSSR